MATHTDPKAKSGVSVKTSRAISASRFLRVVETAAIASARTMGQGERKLSDQVATEAMRQTMDSIPMRGTIVIGEGERDEAPMLYIGEKVGRRISRRHAKCQKSISPSTRSKEPISAPPERPDRLPCWPRPNAADC